MTGHFNEDSRLAAACVDSARLWTAALITQDSRKSLQKMSSDIAELSASLESGRLAVVEVALVERLVATLVAEAPVCNHGFMSNEECRKAARFGGPIPDWGDEYRCKVHLRDESPEEPNEWAGRLWDTIDAARAAGFGKVP